MLKNIAAATAAVDDIGILVDLMAEFHLADG